MSKLSEESDDFPFLGCLFLILLAIVFAAVGVGIFIFIIRVALHI